MARERARLNPAFVGADERIVGRLVENGEYSGLISLEELEPLFGVIACWAMENKSVVPGVKAKSEWVSIGIENKFLNIAMGLSLVQPVKGNVGIKYALSNGDGGLSLVNNYVWVTTDASGIFARSMLKTVQVPKQVRMALSDPNKLVHEAVSSRLAELHPHFRGVVSESEFTIRENGLWVGLRIG